METNLYLIESASGEVKIGVTQDLSSRLSRLQTGNPYLLTYVCIVPLSDRKSAEQLEAFLHTLFDVYRMSGEWFNIDAETVISSIEAMRDLPQLMENAQVTVYPSPGDRTDKRTVIVQHFADHPEDLDAGVRPMADKLTELYGMNFSHGYVGDIRKSILDEEPHSNGKS